MKMREVKTLIALLIATCVLMIGIRLAKPMSAGIIANGECGEQGDNIIWTLTDDGVLTLAGAGKMCNAYDSENISWLFPWREFVNRVAFDGEITSIGAYTFFGCSELVEITLPGTLTEIGKYAFCGCRKMELTEIPAGVTTIGAGAFDNCISMSLPLGYLPEGAQGYTCKGGM